MDPISCLFDRASIPVLENRGINHAKIKGFCQEMAKENFIPGMEEVNWNQNSHMTPAFSIILGKLGKGYKRFNNLKHSKGLLYRLFLDSLPTKNIKKGKIKPSLERTCITGGHRNAVEVCFQEGN